MGAGKTTTIGSICEHLDVEDSISSPTFSIVNEYFSSKIGTIYHFDFYRVESNEEAFNIGVEDYFYSGYLCLVEWPNKVVDLLPEQFLLFRIKEVADSVRELIVEKHV